MSGKLDSAESMINGLKSYKQLDSLHKTARKYDSKRKCTNCSFDGLCPNNVLIICTKSFEKGFITGVKYHRNIIKNKKK